MGLRTSWLHYKAVVLVTLITSPVVAQEFGLYLACSGSIEAKGETLEAFIRLALRRNSSVALVQRSNILLAGDLLRLETAPGYYSMIFRAPSYGSVAYHDWVRGAIFIWNPDLQKLRAARISVDRRTGVLEGLLLDGAENSLGQIRMLCEAKSNESFAVPKF